MLVAVVSVLSVVVCISVACIFFVYRRGLKRGQRDKMGRQMSSGMSSGHKTPGEGESAIPYVWLSDQDCRSKEGAAKETGGGIENKREDSSEDEKSDDLADLYVNDEEAEEPADAIAPGAQVQMSELKKADSLDGVYEKNDDQTQGNA